MSEFIVDEPKARSARLNQKALYTLYGMAIGLIFPVGGTLIRSGLAQLPWSLGSLAYVQSSDPMLWIIDSAPVVLAVFARLIGARQDRLLEMNRRLGQREKELESAGAELEQRVKERTAAIEEANRQIALRASRLQAVADISQSLALIQDTEELLSTVTTSISERFGHYHVGVFLIDEENQYAVLRAANSAGGRQMLSRGHRLRVGRAGLVGYVARYGRPRIARDVGADPVFFDDPELPDTHSEAALPLKVGDRSIGVLDVQSVDVHALGPEDIDVLSVLANQVGIAVENSRMFGRTRRALDSLSEVSSREIDSMARERGALGYTYSPDGKVTQAVELDEATSRSALGSGRTFMPDPSSQAIAPNMAIPVKLRDQVIGLITVQASDKSREWSENELALVRTISERAAAALENATLLAESQRRAAKERAIGEISARIGASTRFDSILQTAARELSRALGGSDVLVQIEPVAMDHATKAEGS